MGREGWTRSHPTAWDRVVWGETLVMLSSPGTRVALSPYKQAMKVKVSPACAGGAKG